MTDLKTCTKCGTTKPLTDFNNMKASKDGKAWHCRACQNAHSAAAYRKNPEPYKQWAREWAAANPEKRKEAARKATRKWSRENNERVNDWNRAWRARNPEAMRALYARKKAYRKTARTCWDVDLDSLVEIEAHDLCAIRSKAFGFDWHVDHVVPLKAKLASGLHNAYNLAVIPAQVNVSKKNRYWPDMP